MEKVLVGLNFYGRDFSSSGLKDVLGHDYTAALERDGAVLHWDEAYQEHKLTYNERGQTHQMFYPSTRSLQVSTRRQAISRHENATSLARLIAGRQKNITPLPDIPFACSHPSLFSGQG